jgi:hypothetical protein
MVLIDRPSSGGTAQDAYEILDGVFGGGEFTEREAIDALTQAMSISDGAARQALNSLGNVGCIRV